MNFDNALKNVVILSSSIIGFGLVVSMLASNYMFLAMATMIGIVALGVGFIIVNFIEFKYTETSKIIHVMDDCIIEETINRNEELVFEN